MATFFTSDTHFGDAHILRQRGGGFGSLDDHDAALIEGWNDVVGTDDDVWHLGDFAAGASRGRCVEIFEALRGRKRLIRGNHDTNRVLELPWVKPPQETARITVSDADGTEWRLFLAHYAHRAWPGLWRGTRHLYGHTHGSLPDTRFSCDVGVDAWGYRPVGVGELITRQNQAHAVPEELQRQNETRTI